MNQKLKPIFLPDHLYESMRFKTTRKGRSNFTLPVRDRLEHGQKLIQRYNEAIKNFKLLKNNDHGTNDGSYVEFIGAADCDLAVQSLENLNAGIRLLNVNESNPHSAVVYIPDDKQSNILKKIDDYLHKPLSKKNKPRNATLIDSIEEIRVAELNTFWRSDSKEIPTNDKQWCEIWILNESNQYKEQIVLEVKLFAHKYNITIKDQILEFPENIIFLAHVNKNDLIHLLANVSCVSEFRLAKTTARFWMDLPPREQKESVDELLSRIKFSDSQAQVLLLDTGVNHGHDLLKNCIDDKDLLTVESSWGVSDHHGHGTLMAGMALYGNLEYSLETSSTINISHSLCSVKILPPNSNTDRELWGEIVQRAIARAIINNPEKKFLTCMAVTSSDEKTFGQPTSWSSAIDQIIFSERIPFFISAGNIDPSLTKDYFASNLLSEVQDPAQAWNAITIGAYTEKDYITEKLPFPFSYVAKNGELSPYSTTSCMWQQLWPHKPEVVFEGGNLYKDAHGAFSHDDLCLMSTYYNHTKYQFYPFNQTSAATGQAAYFAAKIQHEFPEIWPETIKGLIVHSAEWTNAMKKQFSSKHMTIKQLSQKLLQTVGYGVPNLDRALYCANNRLTLIAQNTIQPYIKEDEHIKTNEIHFYSLPWPKEILQQLDSIQIQMRITLSYFIEPSPGNNGWKSTTRYRYASHGLRFDIKEPLEEPEAFKKRKNKFLQEQDTDYESSEFSSSDKWLIGEQRNNSTTISDIWSGSAYDLSLCNLIAIFPIGGWWKTRDYLNKWDEKVHYSLIVSIDTPDETIDIYTPVKNLISVPVEIETSH